MGGLCCGGYCPSNDPTAVVVLGEQNLSSEPTKVQSIDESRTLVPESLEVVSQQFNSSDSNESRGDTNFPSGKLNEACLHNAKGRPSALESCLMKDYPLYDGAYLIYSTAKNGSLIIVWSKEPLADAIAFARRSPLFNVPLFKYRHPKEIVCEVSTQSKLFLHGFALFFRSVYAFHSEAILYDLSKYSQISDNVVVFLHKKNNEVLCMDYHLGFFSFHDADALLCCYMKSKATKKILSLCHEKDISFKAFDKVVSEWYSHCESVQLLHRHI